MGRTAKKRRRKQRRPRAAAAPTTAATGQDTGEAARGETRPEKSQGARPPRPGAKPELPAPPWGSFPLSELITLLALVLFVAGFFVEPPRGPVMLGVALALGSLAGLEISLREHLAGYKSHTFLIGGAAGVGLMAVLFALDPGGTPPLIKVGAGLAAFAGVAVLAGRAFRRRSGGELFKVRA